METISVTVGGMKIFSFDKVVLLKILVEEGATLEPDAPVAIFGEAGEDIAALLEEVKSKTASTAAPAAPPVAAAPAAPAATTAAVGRAPGVRSGDFLENVGPGCKICVRNAGGLSSLLLRGYRIERIQDFAPQRRRLYAADSL